MEHLIGDPGDNPPGTLGPHIGALEFPDDTSFGHMARQTMVAITGDGEKRDLLEDKGTLHLMVFEVNR